MSLPSTSPIVGQNSEARSAMPAAQVIQDQPVRWTLFSTLLNRSRNCGSIV